MTAEPVDKRVRLLVVEDEETTRNMYVRNLGLKENYRIDVAADLTAAIQALESCTYQVAIVDIMLAGPKDTANRDGVMVLERLRDLDEGTLAIVLSAQDETQLVREFLKEYDAYDYLSKDALLKRGLDQMIELVAKAGDNSPVGRSPDWDLVVASLAGERDEPMFVSEVMGKLAFKGGFENLRGNLSSTLRYLVPLVPARDDSGGLDFDENRDAFSGLFWSKGQGCAIEFVLSGSTRDGSDASRPEADGVMLEREKGGLRVMVRRRPDEPREAFAR